MDPTPDLLMQTLAAQYHQNGRLAIILRGLPGSGKSYWVNSLCEALPIEASIRLRTHGLFSTDSFFVEQGEYRFDGSKLTQYHQRNLAGFIEALAQREPIVICDNTNLAHWEFLAYETAARALGYEVVRVLVGDPTSRPHQKVCAARNQHCVSFGSITAMARTFEP